MDACMTSWQEQINAKLFYEIFFIWAKGSVMEGTYYQNHRGEVTIGKINFYRNVHFARILIFYITRIHFVCCLNHSHIDLKTDNTAIQHNLCNECLTMWKHLQISHLEIIICWLAVAGLTSASGSTSTINGWAVKLKIWDNMAYLWSFCLFLAICSNMKIYQV